MQAAVRRIVTWDGDLDEASAPLSVTLVLDRELDISRGDLIAAADAPAAMAQSVQTSLVWMDAEPLDRARRYLVKHASHTVSAFIGALDHRINIETLAHEPAETLEMNHIGTVRLSLSRPIAFDPYAANHAHRRADPRRSGDQSHSGRGDDCIRRRCRVRSFLRQQQLGTGDVR